MDCETARKQISRDAERWIDVEWDEEVSGMFRTLIEITADDERGILGRIASEITASNADILQVAMDTESEQVASSASRCRSRTATTWPKSSGACASSHRPAPSPGPDTPGLASPRPAPGKSAPHEKTPIARQGDGCFSVGPSWARQAGPNAHHYLRRAFFIESIATASTMMPPLMMYCQYGFTPMYDRP